MVTDGGYIDETRNCKNYMTDGGDRLVIGGTLEILDIASVIGLPLGNASIDEPGLVYQAENQPASEAADVAALVNDLNALLSKLKDAGIMGADPAGGA